MQRSVTSPRPAAGAVLRAWCVHLLTVSGAVWGLLALVATARTHFGAALGFMGAALAVDSVDGVLARRWRAAETLPGIDGALLDNVLDYFNYVAVPAFFLVRAGALPESLAVPAAGLVCVAGALQFAHAEAKSDDHFFRGFPSYWNVVALYFYLLQPAPALAVAVVMALSVLSLTPLRFVYPSRTPTLRRTTVSLAALWFLTLAGSIVSLPDPPRWLAVLSLTFPLYYAIVSLWLGRASQRQRSGSRGS